MYRYELFRLKQSDIKQLESSASSVDICTLGKWYIFTAPVKDYIEKAESCFRRAMELGNVEAKYHLANMYRLGDLGKVDMERYKSLLNEAVSAGCQLAEIRHCKDIAYGVNQPEDVDRAIEETERMMAEHSAPDPLWYDAIGWMYYAKDDCTTANRYFLNAIDAGYADSYFGLSDMPEKQEDGRRAGCGGSCILLAEELKKKFDESGCNDSNAVECFSDDYQKKAYLDANYNFRKELAEKIEALYVEAAVLGESMGLFLQGKLYYFAQYHHLEDDEKAWECFLRGSELGDMGCMVMLAEMIEEGRAPDKYGWEDACLFRLKALRYGDEDQLLPVMQAYFEGDLDEYRDEIERYYLHLYKVIGYDSDGVLDDDPEDDDGRYDAWA